MENLENGTALLLIDRFEQNLLSKLSKSVGALAGCFIARSHILNFCKNIGRSNGTK